MAKPEEGAPRSDAEESIAPAEQVGRKSSLVRSGSILSLLTLASRILGLLREMTKAALLGTSPLSDAFSVAFMIPNLFRRLFAEGSVSVAFIPTFKAHLIEGDQAKIRDFLASILTFLSFAVSLAVGLGILATPLIVPVFGMQELDETVLLTRVMFPFLGFISIAALFQGILNSVNIFAPAGFAPILLNLVTILCACLLGPVLKNPARAMAVGILLGGFLEAGVQFPFVLKAGFRLSFTGLGRAFRNSGTREVLRLIGPTIIGMAAYQMNDLVSTALAGNAGAGVVSSLQYSLRLQELILGVFAVSIGTVLLPGLAEYAKTARWEAYNNRLIQAMDIIAFITIPISFFAFFQGETLIRLLFQSQRFGDDSVALTLQAFRCHIAGLYFIALNRILAPAFYAQSDSKSPAAAGIASFVVNMALAAALVGPWKGGGVALALTLASAFNTALLLIFLRKNPRIEAGRAAKSAVGYTLKLALFSAAALIPIYFLSPRLLALCAGRGRLVSYGLPLLLTALVFAASGLGLLALTGDRALRAAVNTLRKRRPGNGG